MSDYLWKKGKLLRSFLHENFAMNYLWSLRINSWRSGKVYWMLETEVDETPGSQHCLYNLPNYKGGI